MYIKEVNGEAVEITVQQLKREIKNVSFTSSPSNAQLAEFNVYPVTKNAEPNYDEATQKLVLGSPVKRGNTWEADWQVVEKTESEKEVVRKQGDTAALKVDAEVLALLKARPNQINNYIDANVTNLAEAKNVLKILARTVSVLSQSIVD